MSDLIPVNEPENLVHRRENLAPAGKPRHRRRGGPAHVGVGA